MKELEQIMDICGNQMGNGLCNHVHYDFELIRKLAGKVTELLRDNESCKTKLWRINGEILTDEYESTYIIPKKRKSLHERVREIIHEK